MDVEGREGRREEGKGEEKDTRKERGCVRDVG